MSLRKFFNPLFVKGGGATPTIMGSIIDDSFNPQIGTYTTNGGASYVVSAGNMAIAGGTSALTHYIECADYNYDVENIKFSMTYRMTSTASGQVGPLIIKKSTNATLNYQVYFGIYYCPNNNKAVLQVFGSTVNSLYVGSEFDATTSDDLTIEGNFIESSFVIVAKVNGVQVDTYTINYDISNNPLVGEGKPNESVYRIVEASSTVNVSNITINSQAYKFADIGTVGDSNGAGYFVTNQAARWQQLIRDQYGLAVTIFSGSGDNCASVDRCKESIALFKPNKLILAIGTNDYVSNPSQWEIDYAALVTYFESQGIEVVVCSLMARTGQNYSGSKTFIDSTYTGTNTIIDLFTAFKNPGDNDMNPTYTSDGLHLNAAGAIHYKNTVATALSL